MGVFAHCGVAAVIATNTKAEPVPSLPDISAGVSGGRLADQTGSAVRNLIQAKKQLGCQVDVIACGGILDGATYARYGEMGIKAMQYWTALIYRGPLAAAVIQHEASQIRKQAHE
jgi:dihydroorotate dehydrogenase